MSDFKITKKMEADVKSVLNNLGDPSSLGKSDWVEACIVKQAQADEPEMSAVRAVQEVFAAALTTLGNESPLLAELLQKRFWDDLTVDQVRRSDSFRHTAERTFFNEQKKAIRRLTELLWIEETTCQNNQASSLPDGTPDEARIRTADVPDSSPISGLVITRWPGLLILGSVIVIIVLFMWALGAFSRFQQDIESEVAAVPAETMVDDGVALSAEDDAEAKASELIGTSPKMGSAVADGNALCAPLDEIEATFTDRFVRHQGVSSFTKENTDGGVLGNTVRAIAVGGDGVWAGYHGLLESDTPGFGQFIKTAWLSCKLGSVLENGNVNDLAIDRFGNLWISFEDAGVGVLDGAGLRRFTVEDGLPSNQTYSVFVDPENNVWVGTWEGVARYDGHSWSVPYTVHNNTIFNNHVHAIHVDSTGDVWIGHLGEGDGLSYYRADANEWIHFTADSSGLVGDRIGDIAVRRGILESPDSVWFATDGGVSRYQDGEWTSYTVADGMLSNDVRAIAVDGLNRVWVATAGGGSYFDDEVWTTYSTLDTLDIAFGLQCETCAFDDDHVWTGTTENGLTHSRVPYPEDALDVVEICFIADKSDSECMSLKEVEQTNEISVTYPISLTPGETLRAEIVVEPLAPRQLRQDRGDFLSNVDVDDAMLFGAWKLIPVSGVIEPGQRFIFTDHDNPFVAPHLPEGSANATFASKWRVWMHTRYVGPEITLAFNVTEYDKNE